MQRFQQHFDLYRMTAQQERVEKPGLSYLGFRARDALRSWLVVGKNGVHQVQSSAKSLCLARCIFRGPRHALRGLCLYSALLREVTVSERAATKYALLEWALRHRIVLPRPKKARLQVFQRLAVLFPGAHCPL